VRILDAIRESAATGQAVRILPIVREERPDLAQDIHARAHGKSELVHAAPPSEG
jgi:hypothetical protein